jgi:carbonic anhydrase
MTSEQAFRRLVEGNGHYAAGTPEQTGVSADLRTSLCKGQSPYAAIVGCSDSRVPVELIFDAGPGELFVVRSAGNVVGSTEMGSLEYAIEHLKTPLVLVMGHQHCGAVKAAVAGGTFSDSLEGLLREIRANIPNATSGDMDAAENDNIRQAMAKIAANPVVAKAVSEGAVRLVAAKYSLETGKVSFFK